MQGRWNFRWRLRRTARRYGNFLQTRANSYSVFVLFIGGFPLINNYDVEVLMTIGGGEWGTHDFKTGPHTTLPIAFPPGTYTTTLTVPGVGNFRFADGRADFEEGKCYTFRVP